MWALPVEAVLPFVDGAPHADGAPPAGVGGPTDRAPPADAPRGPAPEVVRTDEGRTVPFRRGGRRRRLAGAAPPAGVAPSAGAAPPAGAAPLAGAAPPAGGAPPPGPTGNSGPLRGRPRGVTKPRHRGGKRVSACALTSERRLSAKGPHPIILPVVSHSWCPPERPGGGLLARFVTNENGGKSASSPRAAH